MNAKFFDIFTFLFLLFLTLASGIYWHQGADFSLKTVVSSQLIKEADSMIITRGTVKIVVKLLYSKISEPKEDSLQNETVDSQIPSYSGIMGEDEHEHLHLERLATIDGVIDLISIQPFFRKLDSGEIKKLNSDFENVSVIFSKNGNNLCILSVGPLSFSGAEVYVRKVNIPSVKSTSYIVKRALFDYLLQLLPSK